MRLGFMKIIGLLFLIVFKSRFLVSCGVDGMIIFKSAICVNRVLGFWLW